MVLILIPNGMNQKKTNHRITSQVSEFAHQSTSQVSEFAIAVTVTGLPYITILKIQM
jgi:hypothetical protein